MKAEPSDDLDEAEPRIAVPILRYKILRVLIGDRFSLRYPLRLTVIEKTESLIRLA
jgi:hypothetical protein